ncbi:hypothetical protein JW859_09370 [bacterium]|nr:hypothetical protein [bacterium]
MDLGTNQQEQLVTKVLRLTDWYQQWCAPIVKAVYDQDFRLVQQLITQVRQRLAASDLDADGKQSLALRIRYVEWQAERILNPHVRAEQLNRDILAALADVDAGPISQSLACIIRLQVRSTLLRDEQADYPAVDFERDFAGVLPEMRSLEFWHYVSSWAFLKQRVDFVEQAMAEHTIHADGYMSDFLWQRINLMYQVLKGKATRQDVEEIVKRLENMFQWVNVEKVLWPALEETGLVDDEIREMLAAQLTRIRQAPQAPRRGPATKRIIKQ